MFTRVIEQTLDELPEPFARHLDNVQIVVESANEHEPDLYGLYEGVPLPQRTGDGLDWTGPSLVFVYRRTLVEDFGDDPTTLAREIRVTLLHELAHHFGIDDARLTELGWN